MMQVALMVGGRSGEHDVSLETGRGVAESLSRLGHRSFELVLGKEGGARWPGGEGSLAEALVALDRWGPDAAFIAMHGQDGEDGRVQAILELLEIPFQGSGMAASALGLDKARTKDIYRLAGLPVAPDRVIDADEPHPPDWPAIAAELGLPLFIKTAKSGSSVGVERVETVEALADRGAWWLARTRQLVVEAYLPGAELTCAVLEAPDGTPEALPLVEIVPLTAAFFDYEAKYTPGATDEICPARVSDELAAEVSRLGLAAHRLLGCAGYSRTDVKLDAAGEPRLLETNTLPGLTPTSLLPQAAAAIGLSFDDLIERLLLRAVAGSRERSKRDA